MKILDELKNQFLSDDDNKANTNTLPWEDNINNTNVQNLTSKKINKNQLSKIGIIILLICIICIACYNLLNNKNSYVEETETSSETQEDKKQEIKVHVAGEINNPGLYKLESGSRVWDAIQAAGGAKDSADTNSLNLAKLLEDGEQVLINPKQTTGSSSQTTTQSENTNNGKVNINTADATALQTLSGVGPSTAQKIIDYRTQNGKFKTIDDIKKISGIGEKTFEKFKDKICV